MLKQIRAVPFLIVMLLALANSPSLAQAPAAVALLQETAKAMGGLAALRALNNQVIESDGKQFDSSSTNQPLGPTRQISTFRYTLTARPQATEIAPRLGRGAVQRATKPFASSKLSTARSACFRKAAPARGKFRLHPGRLVTRRARNAQPSQNLSLPLWDKRVCRTEALPNWTASLWHCRPS